MKISREEFDKAMLQAKKWVDTWPDWKRNNLRDSLKSESSIPRSVVIGRTNPN